MKAQLPMVVSGLVDMAGKDSPQLLGSRCPDCGHYAYPASGLCSECGSEMGSVELGSSGTLYSYTTVRVKPPLGLPQPYSVGYIDLDNAPLRVFGLLDCSDEAACTIGATVKLKVGELGVNRDGAPCLRPYFAPDSRNPLQEPNQD